MLQKLKDWARALKRDVHALYLCGRDPRVPLFAKAVALAVAAYALSPVDLIPDFIPVLGYLDDLILIPLGIWLAIRLVPAEIMAEHRVAAEKAAAAPRSLAGAMVVGVIWLAIAGLAAWVLWIRFR